MGRLLAAIVAVAVTTLLVSTAWLVVDTWPGGGIAGREPVSIGIDPAVPAPPTPAPAPVAPTPVPAEPGPAPTTAAAIVPEAAPPVTAPSIPVSSGLLSSLPGQAVNAPVAIRIADLSISADVAPVGFDARKDQMEVPRSPSLVGWYEFSPSPGDDGSAVLAAHVDWGGRRGIFYDLHSIAEGTVVSIAYQDGTERHFEVFAARQYDKSVLPVDDIFTKGGDPVLTLVTCGGIFDGARGSYRDNIVVYARPVESFVEAHTGRA